ALLFLIALLPAAASAQQQEGNSSGAGKVTVISSDFVLPAKMQRLERIAGETGAFFENIYVERAQGEPAQWFSGAELVILDTPRPIDVVKVQGQLGAVLHEIKTPWIQV